jgi:DNA ligase-4
MGFKFSFLCDLLSALEDVRVLKATTQARNRDPDVRVVTEWFVRHGKRLRDPDNDQLALLSCMFPVKRTDRVYWLQDTNLARLIGRCLLLGSSRRQELEKWRVSGGGDLGQCVENVMRQAENVIPAGQEVNVEEIDYALTQIASRCRFSGPTVRRQRSAVDVEETLSPIYRRLSSRDAKWLTRMILKSHFSEIVPERLTLASYHFLLPHLLLFQNSFEAAVNLISSQPIRHFPAKPEPSLARDLGKIALHHLVPITGTKIGRPEYYKARSIKHCCKMIDQRRMSVERKYDGEYCQIHIDLSKHPHSIQIFSKSGKDSTADRAGVHQAIKDSLKIGQPECKFSHRCILEGELLVWSEERQSILQFHKLRKFISRSGTFIGIDCHSPSVIHEYRLRNSANWSRPQPYEHLMIMFFDILLLDDNICLRKPHRERRLLLKDTVQIIPGLADIADQRVIDFSRPDGQSKLESFFSMGIAERWEGLVLKGCEDPYFPILINPGDSCTGRWIKLKKDYIPGLGDTIDVALIGAAYNARDASTLTREKRLSWTHFFVGCLENKDAVLQGSATPRFCIVDVIDHHCMSPTMMQTLNTSGKYGARRADSCDDTDFEYGRPGIPRMDVVFKTPFVVEMLGGSFEKPSGARYYTLRFPRILKIHSDRSFEDAVSFRELQDLAGSAVSIPEDSLEEEAEWAKRVKSSTSMAGYIRDRSQSVSTVGTRSPSKSVISNASQNEEDSSPCRSRNDSRQHCREGPLCQTSDTGTETIPIYVDRRASNSPVSTVDADSSILASNGNLSSQGVSRKRTASYLTPEPRNENVDTEARKQSTADVLKYPRLRVAASFSAYLPTFEVGSTPSKYVTRDQQVLQRHSRKTDSERPKSPLSEIPLYVISATHPGQHSQKIAGLTNVAHTIDEFFLMLKSTWIAQKKFSCTGHISQKLTLGMIFLDELHTPLGPKLKDLCNRLTQTLRLSTPNLPPGARILILRTKFLEIYRSLKHYHFCLRRTWEKLSREYFCACIAWDCKSYPHTSVEEIPSTDDCVDLDAPRAHPDWDYIPKPRILSDRKELLILGEFTSLDPPVRAETR